MTDAAGRSRLANPPTDADVARWIDDMRAQKRSPYTIKHYALALHAFDRWRRDHLSGLATLAQAGPSHLKQYQLWLSTRGHYAKSTIYVTLKAIQSFYRFLESPAADALKPPRRTQGLPKYLTEAEASRLLGAAQGDARAHAILALLLYGGFRVGELVALEAHDVDFEEGTLRVRRGKGDKDRLVIVAPKVTGILRRWLETRPPSASNYLFPGAGRNRPLSPRGVQRLVRRVARDAGLEKRVTPHVLRHTLATTLLRRGGDIRFIQRILGHASIATTQIYTHLDDRELRRMYEKAQPDF